MIEHYKLFRFSGRGVPPEVDAALAEELPGLKRAFSGRIRGVDVLKNCASAPDCMDLMICVRAEDEAALQDYLSSPEHRNLTARIRPFVTSACGLEYSRTE